jgi:hypothetical protein
MLFNNPNYDNKLWQEVLEEFKKDGGIVLGQGKYSSVLFHPNWNYVLKIFSNDAFYLKFIRFTMKNSRPSFPKIFDKPRKIVPHFKRTKESEFLYIVPIEKLNPLSKLEWEDIQFYLTYSSENREEYREKYESWKIISARLEEIEKNYPQLIQFKKDYDFFENSGIEGSFDIHKGNIMKRDNGEFVISDPLWEGETPYQAYDRAMKIETDYYGDEYKNDPEYIQGGKKSIKKKSTKKKLVPSSEKFSDTDEVLF